MKTNISNFFDVGVAFSSGWFLTENRKQTTEISQNFKSDPKCHTTTRKSRKKIQSHTRDFFRST